MINVLNVTVSKSKNDNLKILAQSNKINDNPTVITWKKSLVVKVSIITVAANLAILIRTPIELPDLKCRKHVQ